MTSLLFVVFFLYPKPEFSRPTSVQIARMVEVLEAQSVINSQDHFINPSTDGLHVFNGELGLYFAQTDSAELSGRFDTREPDGFGEDDFRIESPAAYHMRWIERRKEVRFSSVRSEGSERFMTVYVRKSWWEQIQFLIRFEENGAVSIVGTFMVIT